MFWWYLKALTLEEDSLSLNLASSLGQSFNACLSKVCICKTGNSLFLVLN